MNLPRYPDRAAVQYATIRNVCYPDATPVKPRSSFSETTSTVILETDGTKLTRVNPNVIREGKDPERRLTHLVHEVAHYGDGGNFGRGNASHSPEFFEEEARLVRLLLENDRVWNAIQAVFTDDLDRDRFLYRFMQSENFYNVDNRSMTDDECEQMVAEQLGYEDPFSNVFVLRGKDEGHFPDNPYAVKIPDAEAEYRFGVGFTDEELLSFAHEYGQEDGNGNVMVPAPLVWIRHDDDVFGTGGPGTEVDPDLWRQTTLDNVGYVYDQDARYVKKALALQDRLGRGIWVTDARVVTDDGVTPALGHGADSETVHDPPKVKASSMWISLDNFA